MFWFLNLPTVCDRLADYDDVSDSFYRQRIPKHRRHTPLVNPKTKKCYSDHSKSLKTNSLANSI
jgi:hypothetical protein